MRGTLKYFGPAIVSGVALSFAFPRFSLFFLAWFALVPLLWRARTLPPVHAALHFFVTGFIFNVLVLQWLLANIMWAGGWAVLGQQLLCVLLGMFWAVAGLVWRWIGERNARLGGPITFALIFVAMEHAESTLFTGFGWTSLAYTQGPDPLALQWAALGSGLAITFLLALTNALIAETLALGRPLSAVIALVVVAVTHGIGFLLLRPATVPDTALKVGVLQSNFSLEMKWDPEYRYETVRNAAEKSSALAYARPIDLMVWPEALILDDMEAPAVKDTLTRMVRDGKFDLFSGAGRTILDKNYNSALLMDKTGTVTSWYDKIHLAPFGEYVPMADALPFITKLVPTIGDLSPGTEPAVMPVRDRKLGPLICFEVLFGQMANRLRRDGADFLVVGTNLAWFGRSTCIPQELEIARVRAVETRLPLVHASNTGVSGVFDPYGRFTPVNLWAASGDRLYPLQGEPALGDLVMARLIGNFALPNAEPQPLLKVQQYVPLAVHALCAGLILLALLMPSAAPRAGSHARD